MTATFKVQSKEGKVVELPAYTREQVQELLTTKDLTVKKKFMDYLKLLGKTAPQLSPMNTEQRLAWVLERYEQLGVSASGASASPAAASAEPAAAPQEAATPKNGSPAPNAAMPAAPKQKPAAQQAPAPKAETLNEAAAAARPTSGSDESTKLLMRVLGAVESISREVAQLRAEVNERFEKVDDGNLRRDDALAKIHKVAGNTLQLVNDAHYLTRVMSTSLTGFSDEDLVDEDWTSKYYNHFLLEPLDYGDVEVQTLSDEDEAPSNDGDDTGNE